MGLADFFSAIAGGFSGFLQPGVAFMLVPLFAYLVAEAWDAPPPWRAAMAGRRALMLGLAFAFGFAVALALLVAALGGGSPLLRHLNVLRQLGALAIVLTGLSLLASFCRPGPVWANLPRPEGLWGCWLLGIACGLNWTPVIGPALAKVVVAQAADGGMLLLAGYVLAQVLPFLLAAAALWGLVVILARQDVRGVAGGVAASAVLVLCGLLMLTGAWRTAVLALASGSAAIAGLG